MHLRSVTLVAGAVFLLASSAKADRSLFIIDVSGATIESSFGNDSVIDLVDDFIEQTGDFSGLPVLLGYRGSLDYLGIRDAVQFDVSNLGRTVVLTIPSTGVTQTFNGPTPSAVSQQVEDWIRDDALSAWARLLQSTNALAPLALLSGNPASTVARMGSDPYRRFGFDNSRTRMGFRSQVERWGGVELRVDATASSIDSELFGDDIYTVEPTVTLAGSFNETVGLSFAIIGQYREYNGAQLADLGLELGLPLTILRPDAETSPWFWQITPFVQAAAGASIDLAAGGFFVGGGFVNAVGFHVGDWEYALSNEIAYYGGIPLNNIKGYDFETQLSQLFFKNGAEATWWIGAGFYTDVGIHFTNFAIDDAAVSWYATPTAGVGFQAGRWMDIRIAYEGDFSTGSYSAHGAQLKLDFHF